MSFLSNICCNLVQRFIEKIVVDWLVGFREDVIIMNTLYGAGEIIEHWIKS